MSSQHGGRRRKILIVVISSEWCVMSDWFAVWGHAVNALSHTQVRDWVLVLLMPVFFAAVMLEWWRRYGSTKASGITKLIISEAHSCTPFDPETASTVLPSLPKLLECTNTPSGNINPNVVYGIHSTFSSMMSNIDRSGLEDFAG